MQQLPLFNTAYANREGHIMYLYNAAVAIRARGDYQFWNGVVPGEQSDLIWAAAKIVPYGQLPKVTDPPTGWVQNSNDTPWTSAYSRLLDPSKYPRYLAPLTGITTRAQRGIRTLSPLKKLSFDDVKACKLSTHVETADQFVDDLVAAARKLGSDRAKKAPRCWRNGTVQPITIATAHFFSTASFLAPGTASSSLEDTQHPPTNIGRLTPRAAFPISGKRSDCSTLSPAKWRSNTAAFMCDVVMYFACGEDR